MNYLLSEITQKVYPISRSSLEILEAQFELEIFEKKDIIIRAKASNNKEYFLLDGICRSFLINPLSEETTLSFYTSNTVISPFITRTKKGKSLYNLQALTKVKLASINSTVFAEMRTENTEVRNFAHTVLQNELIKKVDKEVGLASLTAAERLKKFRIDYPMLENLIPHPYIASYLGITNISLSRLRRNLKE